MKIRFDKDLEPDLIHCTSPKSYGSFFRKGLRNTFWVYRYLLRSFEFASILNMFFCVIY